MPSESKPTAHRVDAGAKPDVVTVVAQPDPGEDGYSTAELLGNAALAIGALGLIWVAIGDMGQEIVDWIGSQLMNG